MKIDRERLATPSVLASEQLAHAILVATWQAIGLRGDDAYGTRRNGADGLDLAPALDERRCVWSRWRKFRAGVGFWRIRVSAMVPRTRQCGR
jgi:hypothetical protein